METTGSNEYNVHVPINQISKLIKQENDFAVGTHNGKPISFIHAVSRDEYENLQFPENKGNSDIKDEFNE